MIPAERVMRPWIWSPWINGRFQWGTRWEVHTADGRTLDPFSTSQRLWSPPARPLERFCDGAGAGHHRQRSRHSGGAYAPLLWRIISVTLVQTSTICPIGRLPCD